MHDWPRHSLQHLPRCRLTGGVFLWSRYPADGTTRLAELRPVLRQVRRLSRGFPAARRQCSRPVVMSRCLTFVAANDSRAANDPVVPYLTTADAKVLASGDEWTKGRLSYWVEGCAHDTRVSRRRSDTSGREGADHHIVAIRISKGELHRCCIRVPVRLLLELGYQRARPRQRLVEIINPEEQQQAENRPIAPQCALRCRRL